MGGTVGFTIRTKGGKQHRMTRWTNILPWALMSKGTFEKDPKHLRDVLKQWRDMRKDYAEHLLNGNPPKHPMTLQYAPYPLLAPVSYGLVVWDMKKNVILTMQDYTHLNNLSPFFYHDVDDDTQVRELFEAGRVKGWWAGRVKNFTIPLPPDCTWEQFADITKKDEALECNGSFHHFFGIDIDMSPFTVERFTPSVDGCIAMRLRVLELGFVLTTEEETAWAEHIQRLREFEE